jgi:ribonuclease E
MKDNLRFDRARVQMGKISGFGLLELSRQRRRTGVLEGTSHACEHCQGSGRVRSVESASLALLRALDEAAAKQKNHLIEARTASDVAIYLLNEKRDALAAIEDNRSVRVRVGAGAGMTSGDFEINIADASFEEEAEEAAPEAAPARGRKPPRRDVEAEAEEADALAESAAAEEVEEEEAAPEVGGDGDAEDRKRRRRRGRRGGKRRRDEGEAEPRTQKEPAAPQPAAAGEGRSERNGRRRRRGRGRARRVYEVDGGEWLDFVSADLKHLTPRPERPARNGDARRKEPAPAEPDQTSPPAPQDAEIFVHPATEPVTETYSEAIAVAAEAAQPAPATAMEQPNYEPDQERRDKFFSRLSRWSKKS